MRSHSSRSGFTLIELMIVIVVIGLLLALIIPNVITLQNKKKDGHVRANMHTLQLLAEDYAMQNEGCYAHDPKDVLALLSNGGLTFKNPVTGQPDLLNSRQPGSCFYQDSAGVKYVIYGFGHDGRVIDLGLTGHR